MSTATIAQINIESAAQDNIISYIDNRNYVKDPRSPLGANTRLFVYESDPLIKAINFSDFPYIIVNFPTVNQTLPTADGKHKLIEWEHSIIVRAVKDGSANTRNDIGRTDMLSIGDDLIELFNNRTRQQELDALNIRQIWINKTFNDSVSIKEKIVYEAGYALKYWSRIQTSS